MPKVSDVLQGLGKLCDQWFDSPEQDSSRAPDAVYQPIQQQPIQQQPIQQQPIQRLHQQQFEQQVLFQQQPIQQLQQQQFEQQVLLQQQKFEQQVLLQQQQIQQQLEALAARLSSHHDTTPTNVGSGTAGDTQFLPGQGVAEANKTKTTRTGSAKGTTGKKSTKSAIHKPKSQQGSCKTPKTKTPKTKTAMDRVDPTAKDWKIPLNCWREWVVHENTKPLWTQEPFLKQELHKTFTGAKANIWWANLSEAKRFLVANNFNNWISQSRTAPPQADANGNLFRAYEAYQQQKNRAKPPNVKQEPVDLTQ